MPWWAVEFCIATLLKDLGIPAKDLLSKLCGVSRRQMIFQRNKNFHGRVDSCWNIGLQFACKQPLSQCCQDSLLKFLLSQGRLGGLQEELNSRASSALTFLQRQSDAEQPVELQEPEQKRSGGLFGSFMRSNRQAHDSADL